MIIFPLDLKFKKRSCFSFVFENFFRRYFILGRKNNEAKGLLIFTIDVMNVFCPNIVQIKTTY